MLQFCSLGIRGLENNVTQPFAVSWKPGVFTTPLHTHIHTSARAHTRLLALGLTLSPRHGNLSSCRAVIGQSVLVGALQPIGGRPAEAPPSPPHPRKWLGLREWTARGRTHGDPFLGPGYPPSAARPPARLGPATSPAAAALRARHGVRGLSWQRPGPRAPPLLAPPPPRPHRGRPGRRPMRGRERLSRLLPRWLSARARSRPRPAPCGVRRLPRGARRQCSGQRLRAAAHERPKRGPGLGAPRAPGAPRSRAEPGGPAAAMPDELTEPGRATPARAASFLIENLLAAGAKGAGRAAQGGGGREDGLDDDGDPEDGDAEQARRRRQQQQRRRQLRAGGGPGGEARARALLGPGALGLGPRPPPGPGPPHSPGRGGATRWCPRARGGYGGGLSPDSELGSRGVGPAGRLGFSPRVRSAAWTWWAPLSGSDRLRSAGPPQVPGRRVWRPTARDRSGAVSQGLGFTHCQALRVPGGWRACGEGLGTGDS